MLWGYVSAGNIKYKRPRRRFSIQSSWLLWGNLEEGKIENRLLGNIGLYVHDFCFGNYWWKWGLQLLINRLSWPLMFQDMIILVVRQLQGCMYSWSERPSNELYIISMVLDGRNLWNSPLSLCDHRKYGSKSRCSCNKMQCLMHLNMATGHI